MTSPPPMDGGSEEEFDEESFGEDDENDFVRRPPPSSPQEGGSWSGEEGSYYSDERSGSSRSYYSDEESYGERSGGSRTSRRRDEETDPQDDSYADDDHESYTDNHEGSFQSAGEGSHTDRDRSSRSGLSGSYDSRDRSDNSQRDDRSYDSSRAERSLPSQDDRSYDSQERSFNSQEDRSFDSRSYDSRGEERSYNSQEDKSYDSRADRSFNSQEDRSYDSQEDQTFGESHDLTSNDDGSYDSERDRSYSQQDGSFNSRSFDSREASYQSQDRMDPPPGDNVNQESFHSEDRSNHHDDDDGQDGNNESFVSNFEASFAEESPLPPPEPQNEDGQSFSERDVSSSENDSAYDSHSQSSRTEGEQSVAPHGDDSDSGPPAVEETEQDAGFGEGFSAFQDSPFENFDSSFGDTDDKNVDDPKASGQGAFDGGNDFEQTVGDTSILDGAFGFGAFDDKEMDVATTPVDGGFGDPFSNSECGVVADEGKGVNDNLGTKDAVTPDNPSPFDAPFQMDTTDTSEFASDGFAIFDGKGDTGVGDPFAHDDETNEEKCGRFDSDFGGSCAAKDKGNMQPSGEEAAETPISQSNAREVTESPDDVSSPTQVPEQERDNVSEQGSSSRPTEQEENDVSDSNDGDGTSASEQSSTSESDSLDESVSAQKKNTDSDGKHEIASSPPGTANFSFSIKEPNPDKKTLIILCTMFPTSEEEAEVQDRAMKLCKANGIIPHIIMGQQKPPQRDELLAISNLKDFPQFFLFFRQRVELLGDFSTVQNMVESDGFNPTILEPSCEDIPAGKDKSFVTTDAEETAPRVDATSTDGNFVSTDDDESWSTSDPSEFSRSHENSKSTVFEASFENSKEGSTLLNGAPKDLDTNSARSKESPSVEECSEGSIDQDESLRSDSKVHDHQDESFHSNPEDVSAQAKEDSVRSKSETGMAGEPSLQDESGRSASFQSRKSDSEYSQSEYSESRASEPQDESYSTRQEHHDSQSFESQYSQSEYSESRTSTHPDESYSTRKDDEPEDSRQEMHDGEQVKDASSSTQNSRSIAGPLDFSKDEDTTVELDKSMMIGEVFGQPNELFEDFKDKQNLQSVSENEEDHSSETDDDQSSFAEEEPPSFTEERNHSTSERKSPDSSQGSEADESLSLNELRGEEDGHPPHATEPKNEEPNVSFGGKSGEEKIAIKNQSAKSLGTVDKNVKKKKKKRRNKRRREAKSPALLDFAANVNDAMLDLEEFEEINEDIMDSSAHRLLLGFDALLGIFLQLSDELELISTFAKAKKKKDRDAMAPVQALKAVLSFAETFDQLFDDLKPIILDCFEEDPDDEMDDLLYRLNSLVDLLCETTHRVGDRQEWNERSETTYVTLLELMERDALDLRCYFDDVETPDQGVSANIHEAWSATGHIEELRALQYADDPWIFRQICYEVMVSTDQWCPDTSMLMEICGIDPEMLEEEPDPEYLAEDELAPIPQAAEHVLDKVNGDPLPRPVVLASILRRIIPPRAVTDAHLLDHFTSIRNTLDSPLGLSATNIVSITSIPETVNDPDALGVGGMGKSTLAAMVAQHPDVRRYFIDGVVWVYVGDKELNYARYTQCLRELVAQLDFYQGVPLFAELLHTPGEPLSKRRRREEGFMIYARDTIAELLHDRSVLIVLDDVCFEPDLDWFDFAPMPGEDTDDLESNCALLVTTRCRTLLPAADTVEIDMLDEADAISLLIQESGQLSHALLAESREARSVVRECANHPLAVKSVGRWLNLKHATAGVRSSVEEIHAEVIKSMDKILKGGSHSGNDDMLYEIMSMSLSPAINGDPTNIIKFCLAAFIVVFCDREYISDFALTEPTPIIPMDMAELLFETLLEMNESSLLQKGSLFYAQKKEAAVLIPEALSALGVLKVITYSDAEDDEEDPEDEQKFLQVMHFIHHEYGEFLAKEDPGLHDLTKDAERTWNRALVEAYLSHVEEWDIDLDDAAHSYALEMIVSHMIRGGMYSAAAELLADKSFVRGRLLSLGRENCTRRHIKDCETLFSKLRERRPRGSKLEPRSVMKQAYQALGSQLSVDDDEQSIEDSRIKDVEVARAHYEIGFSLAEKRCWDAAVAHWETSQELLESALGIVEVVAGILYNIGVVYSEINEYEQALDSLKQCLRIRGSIHGETHILYAQTIQRIGDIFLNMSDYHEAMESYNWALDVMYTEPTHHRVEIGEILDNKGTIHYSKGEIDEALQCHQEALRSKQYDLGEDHPELAATYHHIGNCLSDQGNVEDAIAHFEEAIRLKEIDPEGGPERDADVLTIEGILHNLEGNQEQGLECYEKSLQILVTKVPYRKEKVASLLHLIGCVYLMSGEQKKAMKLFEESLQARRKVLGFVHLDVASTLFNMAFLHQTRNRLDRALKCLEEALKIRQLRLPDSEKVAVTHEKIGSLARAIGKTKKAQIAFEEALRIRRLVHGEQHEAVATVLQELGDLMDDLGEYDSAMSYYIDALDIRRNRLGLDDIAVAETLYSMGYTLHNNDEPERALVCFEESLSIRRYQLGTDSKEVGDVLNMMGFLKAKKGELDDALTLLWDSLRIRKLQEDHVKVSETLKNIGNVHREKQEQELAIECYEECLRIRRAELGTDHEKVADALIAMGNVESDMQRTDDAMRSFQEALKIRTHVFGDHDESVAAVLQFMGTLEFRANNHAKARDLLTEFIRIRRENETKNDGDYVNVLFMLGNIHKMHSEEAEAKLCWTEAYQVFQELGLAETNPQIAKVMNHLLEVENLEEQDTAKDKKSLFGKVKEKLKKDKTEDDEIKVSTKGRKSRKGRGVQL